jgi:nitrite reductase/ring-hydroxylating ferredoxin subunit/uncharacterized membrane protein
MRSRAHIKAHPIHPALIPFPFAFLTGALLFDALGVLLDDMSYFPMASRMSVVGVIAGLLAAVPGVIDYFSTVPPASSGKRRATIHAVLNIAALLLFAAGWLLRPSNWRPDAMTMICELAGTGVLFYSGWLGGMLVTRNMISVEHRYANAGKWDEATFSRGKGGPLVVGKTDDLTDDQMRLIRVNGHRLVLARTNGAFTVFEDRCTHRGGSLADGVLIDGTVQCLWHGSQFDVTSGAVSCGPAKKGIRVYEVKEKDGDVVLVSPPES